MPNLQLRADIFPVVLTLTPTDSSTTPISYEKARILISLDHVYVFQDTSSGPTLVWDDRLTSYTPPIPATRVRKAADLLNRTATFETEDGFNGEFMKMSSCGCGSRLKNLKLADLFPEETSTPIDQAVSSKDS